MLKIRHAFIPACIGFGPLFMVHMGMDLEGWNSTMSLAGAIMLSYGLIMMWDVLGKLVVSQQANAPQSSASITMRRNGAREETVPGTVSPSRIEFDSPALRSLAATSLGSAPEHFPSLRGYNETDSEKPDGSAFRLIQSAAGR
jgi:hypothetical protein